MRFVLALLLPWLCVSFLFSPAVLHAQSVWEDERGPYGGSYVAIIPHGDGLAAAPHYRSFVLFGDATGETWRQSDLPDEAAQPFSLCSTGGSLLAGGFGRVYRSDDAGTSWQSASLATDLADPVDAMAALGDTVYACAGGRLFRSSDRGLRWTAVAGVSDVRQVAVRDGRVFVAEASRVAESDGGGTQWTVRPGSPEGILLLAVAHGALFAARPGSASIPDEPVLFRLGEAADAWDTTALRGANVLAIAPHEGVLHAGCGGPASPRLLRSDDDGRSWTPVGETRPPFHGDTDVLVLHDAAGALLASVRGHGLWRLAPNAESWRFASDGFFPVGIARVDLAAGRLVAYSMKENTLHVRSVPGATWELLPHPLAERPQDMLCHGDAVLLAARGGTLRTMDFGATWNFASVGDGTARLQALGVAADLLLAGGEGGQHARSTDGGATWQAGTVPGVSGWYGIAAAQDGTPYAATAPNGLLFSTDRGSTWELPINGPSPRWTFDVDVSGADVFLAHNGGIERWSASGGSTLLYGGPAYALCATPLGLAAATQNDGIVFFPGFGEVWGTLKQGLPEAHFAPPDVCRIALRFAGERLYFGNCGLPGLWSIDLSRATGIAGARPPEDVLAASLSPQPFRGTGRLEIRAQAGTALCVRLRDMLGRTRRVLYEGMPPTPFSLPVQLDRAARGAYWIELLQDGRRAVVPVRFVP